MGYYNNVCHQLLVSNEFKLIVGINSLGSIIPSHAYVYNSYKYTRYSFY